MTKPEAEMKSLTLRYLIQRYIVVMVLTGIALVIADYLVEYFFQYRSSAGLGIVAVIVPAMDAGQTFARRKGRLPQNPEAWRLSAILIAVNCAVGVVIVALMSLIPGGAAQLMPILSSLNNGLALGLMTGVFAMYFLATRFFIGSGAKSEMKRQARVAKKQQ